MAMKAFGVIRENKSDLARNATLLLEVSNFVSNEKELQKKCRS